MASKSSPPAAAALASGLVAGRYRIEAPLGKGGVGEVFRVTDLSRGTQLALKRLRSASSEVQRLFEREYQTLASLKHPHTVEVYEYGRDDDGAFYTMELLEGGDLRERAPMPWREACAAIRDSATALGVLHARGLVHRDVSPRNLWRLPDGNVKLIDFGAVSAFGRPAQLIGTPPLVPPEALHGHELDQRADLYSLGAVGYYLVTGRNAYPAREMRELPQLWAQPIVPPSAAIAATAELGAEPIPAELDALLLGLLNQNPLARPASSAELIDRLDTLLGQGSGARPDSAELQLQNAAFVGRVRERRRLRRLLQLAARGRGQSTIIEADGGMGRTRVLHELALDARIADSTVLHVDAAGYPGVYGVASALALKLLDSLPGAARAAALPHAATLAHVSSPLCDRLGVAVDAPPDIAGVLRVRIQAALVEWFEQVATENTLVVLVDGLELIDDGSCAFLLRLAQTCKSTRVLLVCTRLRRGDLQPTAADKALLAASRRMSLTALSDADTLELLQSVFGRPEHLTRLANRLQLTARGAPGHILELVAQLVRAESIRFADGTWILPQEIPDALLPSSRQLALAKRLERLNGPARELAQLLSVQSGAIPPTLWEALTSELSTRTASLDTLLEHEIMTRDADGLRFAHEQFRQTLLAELAPGAKQLALRAVASHLLADPRAGALERLQAGVHLVDSGDMGAVRIVAAAATDITLREPDRLAPAMPMIEHALALFRSAGRAQHECAALLAPLAVAGYFVDRKYAVSYGDQALATLQEVLGLSLAKRLRPRLGRRLGLLVALTVVSVRFLVRRKTLPSPNLTDALTLLFMSVSALAASSGLCYDYQGTQRVADVLEPFAAFGPKYAPGFSYDVCCGLATATRDTFGESHARWSRFVALLEGKQRILGLPDHLRVRYLSGLMFAMSIIDSQRDDDRALRAAVRLDSMGVALYPMSTDQLRSIYYAHHGDAKLYAHYRECAEQRAIQQGAIWQNETWTLLVETVVSLRYHDAMAMKRVAEQLRSASKVIPTLAVFADRSHGAYLLLRNRPLQALPWLEMCLSEEIRANFGWGRSHGVLARAYNDLGRYGDARAACLRVLGVFTPEDLAFPGLTLLIETELLIAEAGLANFERARSGLARLFEQHAPAQGPLTIAELHEAGVRIALLADDEISAETHCEGMARAYETTGIPALIQHSHAVCERARQAALGPLDEPTPLRLSQVPDSNYRSDLARTFASKEQPSRADLAHRELSLLAEQQQGSHGYLYWVKAQTCSPAAALAADPLDAHVEDWMRTRVREELIEKDTVMLTGVEAPTQTSRDLLKVGARCYRLTLLFHRAAADGLIGVAVVARDGLEPDGCSAALLEAVASRLHQGLDTRRPGRPPRPVTQDPA